MRKIEKETRREIVEKTVIYEAVDGTTFSSEENCKKYEESYECSIRACFNKIPQVRTDASSLYFQGEPDDSEAFMLKPRNIEDIHAINAILNFVDHTNKGNGQLVTQDDIGKTIMICFGYDGIIKNGWYWLLRKDEYLKKIETALNQFEASIGENN